MQARWYCNVVGAARAQVPETAVDCHLGRTSYTRDGIKQLPDQMGRLNWCINLVSIVGRTMRIVRRVRPLYLIMHGFISSLETIMWATLLLSFVLLTWSIMAVIRLTRLFEKRCEGGIR